MSAPELAAALWRTVQDYCVRGRLGGFWVGNHFNYACRHHGLENFFILYSARVPDSVESVDPWKCDIVWFCVKKCRFLWFSTVIYCEVYCRLYYTVLYSTIEHSADCGGLGRIQC